METNKAYLYKGKQVFVINYNWQVNGRISNWLSFRVINEDGSLGDKGGCYYDKNEFKELKSEIFVKIKE